jgi:thimet oligopeptidase
VQRDPRRSTAAGALRRSPAPVALAALVALSFAVATTLACPARAAAPAKGQAADPAFFSGGLDAAGFRAYTDGEMKEAQAALDRLLAVKGKRTVQNTYDLYNQISLHSDNAGYVAGLMSSVHPDSSYRSLAETITQEVDKFQTDLSLNRAVYDALAAVDTKGLDKETAYFRDKTLKEFRRSGVDRDDATRAKVAALNEKLTILSQEFDRNIRNDKRSFTVDSAEDLKGLPEDFIASHAPGSDGKIKLTIDYPDYFPIMRYADKGSLREKMRHEALNRAYPANMPPTSPRTR